MKIVSLTQKTFMFVALVTLFVPCFGINRAFAATGGGDADTYIWDGELVALDQTGHMLTVKCHVVADQPMAELKTIMPATGSF